MRVLKARFSHGKILRDKFCQRNTDGCAFHEALLVHAYCACVNSFRPNFLAFRRENADVESSVDDQRKVLLPVFNVNT